MRGEAVSRNEIRRQIRVVLFDLGNVLFLADHRRTIEAYILRHSVPYALAEGYFQRPDYEATGKGLLFWPEYCCRLRKEWQTAIADGEIEQIDASHIYAVDLGAMELVEALMVRQAAVVGFVTNTRWPEWHRYVQLEPRFERDNDRFRVWRSDVAQAYKADEGEPLRIINQWIPSNLAIHVLPEEVLIIDDSPRNCEAFESIRVKAFQYTEGKPWLLEAHLKQLGLF